MIGLADCNNFYASCERAFHPQLRNKAVVVLSNNDGCVIARSNEAKALGIKMGEPAFKIKSLIDRHKVNVFSTNLALYGDMSDRVMSVMREEVKMMEVYSIDEAFLDFSDSSDIERVLAIRKKVLQWTNIPISIGLAHTKVLAKVANHIAKKHTKKGVFILEGDDLIKRALNVFPVEDLWGVGRKYAKRLNEYGIYTALQFREADEGWIKRNFSVNGVRLQRELKGEQCFPLVLTTKRKKNICTARSFGKEVKELSKLQEAVSSYAVTCSAKLRKEKSCCTTVNVFINTNPFKPNAKQYNAYQTIELETPTNDSIEIVEAALKGLKSIYRSDCIYKKAGVIVGSTVPQDEVQMSLFDKVDRNKRKDLMQTVDRVNTLMGRDTVKLAIQGKGRDWKLKQEKLSPCYTTRFADILTVNI